ncbi:MAG: phospholipase, partial [Planctomycetota bacterium]|nr:phospholipase [Planctomycetota bacterium]
KKKVSEAEDNVEQLKESLTKAKLLSSEKQLLLKQREEKVLDFRGKLNAAKSNEEFQIFKNQIAADEQANEILSDEIFEQLERIDELGVLIAGAKDELDSAKDDHSKVKQKVEAEEAGLRSELSRVDEELQQSEEKLPIEVKPDYARVASSRGEESLAALDGEFCGGCFQKITRMQHSDLAANKPVFCKTCGAIIYLPENTVV